MTRADPQVGIIMGSDSDWSVMQRCADKLDNLGVSYEVNVISAHRTPNQCHEYASAAAARGLKVLIAAAGMSAALGGVCAANSVLPVIGVPIASGPLNGFDALLSTAMMPPGVPVAAVAIGEAGATNAAILAVQILATADPACREKIERHKMQMAEGVEKKNLALAQKLKNK